MKKLIIIFIICFITGIATVHAAYQHKQKKPNFFMPENAYQNSAEENIKKQKNLWKKIKQIKATTQRKKTVSDVKSETPRQPSNKDLIAKTKPAEKAPTSDEQTKPAPQLEKSASPVASETPKPASGKDLTTEIKTTKTPTIKNQTQQSAPEEDKNQLSTFLDPTDLPTENSQISKNNAEPKPLMTEIEDKNNSPLQNFDNAPENFDDVRKNLDDTYAQSFSEYQKDLQNISKGKKINNSRLLEMIYEFQGKNRSFTIN